MTIFRIAMLILAGGLGGVALVFFLLYGTQGRSRWLERAQRFGRWAWAACLFWFNVEVWGRVVWILITWP
jgi:hypothetical protein